MDAQFIDLPRVMDPRGSLTFIENSRHIPFDVKRVFFIYDIPSGASRAAHANIELKEFLIALSGSFDVTVDDGKEKRRFRLDRPNIGLYVPNMLWRELDNFSSNSVCLVLASEFYNPEDYHHDYHAFMKALRR